MKKVLGLAIFLAVAQVAQAANIEAGKDLAAAVCAACHGANGVSLSDGTPHDHGSSWAIYGLAVGDTEMTDWRIVQPGDGANPTLVAPERTYVL